MTVFCERCSTTDDEGKAADFSTKGKHWPTGTCKLQFETGLYFHQRGMKTPFTHIDVSFISLSGSDYYVGLK